MNHFSEFSNLLESTDAEGSQKMRGLAVGIQNKVQMNKVKLDIRNVMFQKMSAYSENRK